MLKRACRKLQICPGLNTNEIQIPYDKHQKVSSLVKSHQNTHSSVKYELIRECQITLSNEILIKQYLRLILEISSKLTISGKKQLYVS